MEPTRNNNYSPSAELPDIGAAPGQDFGDQQPGAMPELAQKPLQAVPPGTPTDPATSSQGLAQVLPVTDSPDPQPHTDPTTTAVVLIADDADLIEKEWIIKAKSIVEQTKNDPRQQNIKMNGIKADYLKKRYNKDIKVSEG